MLQTVLKKLEIFDKKKNEFIFVANGCVMRAKKIKFEKGKQEGMVLKY